jgi:hypothetical protein
MARLPRVVVPGLPHHVTQRGNRRQQTFFGDEDYADYRRLLLELISDWARFIGEPDSPDIADLLHAHAGTGRPLGPESFVEALEQRLGCPLKRQKPGPKPPRRDSHTRDLFELPERN